MTAGPVVCDLRALQSPDHRGRGIGRWAYEAATALERVRPDLVGAYLLDPAWPPPGAVDELLTTAKLAYLGSPAADAAVAEARVFTSLSPFELGRRIADVRPPVVDRLGMRYAAVAYDLIPLRRRDHYLAHPAQRRRYLARLEVVRSADAVLAISTAAAADVAELLGVDPARCTVVGTGVSARFSPPASRAVALAEACRAVPGIDGPFVLYPGGNDERKNIEGLIAAWCVLDPAVRAGHRLVVVGDLPPLTANHYRHLARQAGVEEGLVLTGFVGDDELARLYRATALVVFPSRAEGYGLPVAEGLASGAVVAVSDRAPFDELVRDRRARFDPEDPAAIAATMARCLTDRRLRDAVVADGAGAIDRWDDVALRVATALEPLAARPPRPWTCRRRLAVVAPFPPLLTGVAGYTRSLVETLQRVAGRRRGTPALEIDCYCDGLDRYPVAPEPVAGSVPLDARRFTAVDAATGGYDRVLYVLGNSENHSAALAALRRRRGHVLAHDVRLSGLARYSVDTPGAVPGGLDAAIARAYPGLPRELGRHNSLSAAEQDRYGLLLLRDVLDDAERVYVTSEAARRLAELDAGPALVGRIDVVPFAVSRLSAEELAAVELARARREAAGGPAVVASYGIVHPHKRPETLVAALAELVARGGRVELALVGGVSDELRRSLEALAATLGVAGRLHITGDIAWEAYLEALGSADVAVQLRQRSGGEASGTVSECLSAGLPTMVSRIGWMAELPGDAVAHIPHECSAVELADAIGAMLADPPRRAALGAAGRRWAESRTYDAAAEALLDALGI